MLFHTKLSCPQLNSAELSWKVMEAKLVLTPDNPNSSDWQSFLREYSVHIG